METIIKIGINDKQAIELSIEEAKVLKKALDDILGTSQYQLPT